MGAKSKWLAGDIPAARDILSLAFKENTNFEEIWLAVVKVESENNEFERARRLLKKARTSAPVARVFMKSAKLEWQLNETSRAIQLIDEGLQASNDYFKLWLMKAQIFEELNDLSRARETYQEALKNCPQCIPLWILLSNLEVKCSQVIKARSVLERARGRNPQNPELWLHLFRLELKAGNKSIALG
jgi:pre-mRNA-processing factor 6